MSVHITSLTASFTAELLIHELGHVATLRTNGHIDRDYLWWLIEGMAEHVQQNGTPPSRDEGRGDLRRQLSSRTLRSVQVEPPARNGSAAVARARYAIGYYALTHLLGRYGKPATLKFFEQAVQQGVGLDTASRSAFGKPWATVDRETAAAVQRT